MRKLALVALCAISAATAAHAQGVPLQALTEADVGADALKNSACYAHDGPAVLLVATKRNAIVNSDGDLRLLRRLGGGGFPDRGARYGGMGFEVIISPAASESGDLDEGGRSNRPAEIRVVKGKNAGSIAARWNCNSPA
ncbi:MAG TPA: hypothetical protein VD846_14665 [Allosphingosinicella sp.]|nr:hypothetical protein [Allosphingosinicella sp.]